MKKTIKLRGLLSRRVPVEIVTRGTATDEPTTYEIVVSTEVPVRRYDWWTGRDYFEVLGHEEAEVDLRYMSAGGARVRPVAEANLTCSCHPRSSKKARDPGLAHRTRPSNKTSAGQP